MFIYPSRKIIIFYYLLDKFIYRSWVLFPWGFSSSPISCLGEVHHQSQRPLLQHLNSSQNHKDLIFCYFFALIYLNQEKANFLNCLYFLKREKFTKYLNLDKFSLLLFILFQTKKCWIFVFYRQIHFLLN